MIQKTYIILRYSIAEILKKRCVQMKGVLKSAGHGEGNGNPLQYSYLENPIDRGAWQAIVHGVARVGHDLVHCLTPEILPHIPQKPNIPQ